MKNLVELTVEECLDLLGAGGVGRIALCTRAGPRIVPVNYVMYDDAIIFRTTPYSELGQNAPDAEVAFEVDAVDEANHEGWSVIAQGKVATVEDPDELHQLRSTADPGPWAAGQRILYLKVNWFDITGRRIE